jgi:hypothetical protein
MNSIPPSWTNVNSFGVNWTNPVDASGIAGAYYKVGSAPTSNTDGTYSTSKPVPGITVPGEGTYTVYVWLKDNVGNIDYHNYNTVLLRYDATAPAAPTALSATPSSWTNINSFSIDWTNPTDLSGIAGAYYKAGPAPTGPTDGTYVTGKPIIASVPSDGIWTIHLWLKDNAGNRDHNNRNTVTVYYDSAPPTQITDLAVTRTTALTVKLTWSVTSEANFDRYEIYYATHSGVTISDKKWDSSNDSALATISTTSTVITSLTPGTNYYFKIRGKDLAGNGATLSNEVSTTTSAQQRTTWHLRNGANFVSVTCNPPAWTAKTLGVDIKNSIGLNKVFEIMRWNTGTQMWDSVISYDGGITWVGTDFNILSGGGYVIKVTGVASGGVDYSFTGTEIVTPISLTLKTGLNLVGIPYSSTSYTSYLLAQRIKEQNSLPTTGAVEIEWWDPSGGSYVSASYIYFFGSWTPTGVDFPIDPEKGYLVKITQDGSFNP